MSTLEFDCPKALSKKFWLHCRYRKETIGATLRLMMLQEILLEDPGFREEAKELLGIKDSDIGF